MNWRRFELTVKNKNDYDCLEQVIKEKKLSRKDLAVILFGLRVRPGFQRSDFDIQWHNNQEYLLKI